MCNKKKKQEDKENLSLTWSLYSRGSSVIIAIGFFVIFSENLLDKNSMQCYVGNNKETFVNYVVNFCWLHGSHYIPKEFHGNLTPCIIHAENYSNEAITKYYLWLPYILAFLFVLARAPYLIWKRFYSGHIQSVLKVESSDNIIRNFYYYRYLYKDYHLKYSLIENLNLLFLLISFIFTHIVLNQEFLLYGYNIFKYFFGESGAPHPACHIFPTEVSCKFTASSVSGFLDEKNYLCILINNSFNQLFFLFCGFTGFLLFWHQLLVFYSG